MMRHMSPMRIFQEEAVAFQIRRDCSQEEAAA